MMTTIAMTISQMMKKGDNPSNIQETLASTEHLI